MQQVASFSNIGDIGTVTTWLIGLGVRFLLAGDLLSRAAGPQRLSPDAAHTYK